MKTQKYTRAALLRLASKYCFLSGSRGNYRIHTFDATRGCYQETPAGNYAWGVQSVRDARIAHCAELLGLSQYDADRVQGLCARLEGAIDALLMLAGGLAQNDKRYSVELEHCGRAKPQYVARFCGGWIACAPTKGEAWVHAQKHKAERD